MTLKRLSAIALLATLCLAPVPVRPQVPAETSDTPKGVMLLTIFLRHDESKTLDEINAHLKQTGFDQNFPPPGVEVVSWYVMMGIGQWSRCASLQKSCGRSIWSSSTAPGAGPTTPSSIPPTITSPSGRPPTRAGNEDCGRR